MQGQRIMAARRSSKAKVAAANQIGQLKPINTDEITRNPRNPRQTFDPRTIERLAASLEDIGLEYR